MRETTLHQWLDAAFEAAFWFGMGAIALAMLIAATSLFAIAWLP